MFVWQCQMSENGKKKWLSHLPQLRTTSSNVSIRPNKDAKTENIHFFSWNQKNVAPFLKTPEHKCYNLFVRSWIICRTDFNWTCGAASDDHCLHQYKYITINKMIIIVILLIISKVTSAKYQNVNIFCLYIYESNKRKNLSHSRYFCSKWLKRFLKLLIFCPSTNGWLD